MTELEMSVTLGLLIEPEKNFVHIDKDLKEDINHIANAFTEISRQKCTLGAFHTDIWLEFVPWHSLN